MRFRPHLACFLEKPGNASLILSDSKPGPKKIELLLISDDARFFRSSERSESKALQFVFSIYYLLS
jgi:hypothetical protein